jgi:hypothetical protein
VKKPGLVGSDPEEPSRGESECRCWILVDALTVASENICDEEIEATHFTTEGACVVPNVPLMACNDETTMV